MHIVSEDLELSGKWVDLKLLKKFYLSVDEHKVLGEMLINLQACGRLNFVRA